MKYTKSYIASLLLLSAAFTACDEELDRPPVIVPEATIEANTSILEVKNKYWNENRNYIDTIGVNSLGEHIVISGRIISSDETGNIYKNLVIQDESAALTISINENDMFESYHIGQEVVIDLTDMYIGKYNGLQQLGFPEYSTQYGWEATFMEMDFFKQHAQFNELPKPTEIDTIAVDITKLNAIKSNADSLQKWQSQLVRFDSVQWVEAGKPYSEASASTNRYIKDANGNVLKDEFGQPLRREAAVINIVVPSEDGTGETIVSDANSIITGGSLGGLIHSTDVDAEGVNPGVAQKTLDIIAQGIAKLFNDLNTRNGAYSINPNDTGKLVATTADNFLFVGPDGTADSISAGNIKVRDDLLTEDGCWDIACAFFDDPANFDENAVGNAQNVVDMLGTRNKKLAELGNMSLEDYYTNLLGKVGAGGSNMQALVDTQTSVVDSIKNKILSNNSVDLNEELVDLVKYQTAYSAAAQVFNTCNSCLDVLMTLGG